MSPTENIRVYNYPAQPNTYTYLVRVYMENGIEVEGEPIYLHNLGFQTQALARLYGEIQDTLSKVLPR